MNVACPASSYLAGHSLSIPYAPEIDADGLPGLSAPRVRLKFPEPLTLITAPGGDMSDTDPRYPDAHREFEIRVSPDQREIAEFRPTNAPWFIPDVNCKGRFVRTAALDRAGWVQYVPAADRGKILAIVADWAYRSAEYGGLDSGDLVWNLEQAGFTLPDIETARALVGDV